MMLDLGDFAGDLKAHLSLLQTSCNVMKFSKDDNYTHQGLDEDTTHAEARCFTFAIDDLERQGK